MRSTALYLAPGMILAACFESHLDVQELEFEMINCSQSPEERVTAAAEDELHVVGVGGRPLSGVTTVMVDRSPSTLLVLSSHQEMRWAVAQTERARIRGVMISSRQEDVTWQVPEGVPVVARLGVDDWLGVWGAGEEVDDNVCCGEERGDTDELLRIAVDLTGVPWTSFHGCSYLDEIRIGAR